MHQFDCRRGALDPHLLRARKLPGGKRKQRTHALTAAEHRVTHRLVKARG